MRLLLILTLTLNKENILKFQSENNSDWLNHVDLANNKLCTLLIYKRLRIVFRMIDEPVCMTHLNIESRHEVLIPAYHVNSTPDCPDL